jgi:hypothetical protein
MDEEGDRQHGGKAHMIRNNARHQQTSDRR